MEDIIFSIEGFNDPLYFGNTGGDYNNTIRASNTSYWDLAVLQQHIALRTYKYEPRAPSFLMRFENGTSGSFCCGMESIIYDSMPHKADRSYVDYCYFSDVCDTGPDEYGRLYNVTGITTAAYQFQIRAYHLDKYNVTDYASNPNT